MDYRIYLAREFHIVLGYSVFLIFLKCFKLGVSVASVSSWVRPVAVPLNPIKKSKLRTGVQYYVGLFILLLSSVGLLNELRVLQKYNLNYSQRRQRLLLT
jgi:hypothetical protein